METRSSGLPMFLGAYSMCILLVSCLILIKYDATTIREDELILTPIMPVAKKAPRNYYVMNPLKSEPATELDRPTQANILVATLPAAEESVVRQQMGLQEFWDGVVEGATLLSRMRVTFAPVDSAANNGSVDLAFSDLRRPLFRDQPVDLADPFAEIERDAQIVERSPFRSTSFSNDLGTAPVKGQKVSESSFVEKSPRTRLIRMPDTNPEERTFIGLLDRKEPHEIIAEDDDLRNLIHDQLLRLAEINVDIEAVIEITEEVELTFEQAELDAGQCEAGLYRIVTSLHALEILPTEREVAPAEDQRLLQSVRDRVREAVGESLELLNGGQPNDGSEEAIRIEPQEELNFQKLNMAIQSLLQSRWF